MRIRKQRDHGNHVDGDQTEAGEPAMAATDGTGSSLRRRGLLAGVAALVAGAVFKQSEQPASAHDAQDVLLGGPNTTGTDTTIRNTVTTSGSALNLHCDNANYGFGLQATGTAYGVYATGGQYAGVAGDTSNPGGAGVTGQARSASGGAGVSGYSAAGQGTVGSTTMGLGVLGRAGSIALRAPKATAGVYGLADGEVGIGGVFEGTRAPLRLIPSAIAGAPSTGAHEVGELFVDSTGRLYFCRASGTPGTWIALGVVGGDSRSASAYVALANPERFVDTRIGLGGVRGPVPGATTHTFVMTGRTGQSGDASLQIPDAATSIVGNLTVIGGPGAQGYVTLWPSGPVPTVSNINFGPGPGAVANSFVVRLAQTGSHGQLNAFNLQSCDYVLDVSGYYTGA